MNAIVTIPFEEIPITLDSGMHCGMFAGFADLDAKGYVTDLTLNFHVHVPGTGWVAKPVYLSEPAATDKSWDAELYRKIAHSIRTECQASIEEALEEYQASRPATIADRRNAEVV